MAKVRTGYEPRRYRHRPTIVEGILYDGDPECARAIVDWGRERTGNTPFEVLDGDLHMHTRQGSRYLPAGDLAVLGVVREAYSIDPEVRELSYVLLAKKDFSAPPTLRRVRELTEESHSAGVDRLREINAELLSLCEALLS